jgi:hypothetical protein
VAKRLFELMFSFPVRVLGLWVVLCRTGCLVELGSSTNAHIGFSDPLGRGQVLPNTVWSTFVEICVHFFEVRPFLSEEKKSSAHSSYDLDLPHWLSEDKFSSTP